MMSINFYVNFYFLFLLINIFKQNKRIKKLVCTECFAFATQNFVKQA